MLQKLASFNLTPTGIFLAKNQTEVVAIAPLLHLAFLKATIADRTATVKLDFASAAQLILLTECARQC